MPPRRRARGVDEEGQEGDVAESDVATCLVDSVPNQGGRHVSRDVYVESRSDHLKDLPHEAKDEYVRGA